MTRSTLFGRRIHIAGCISGSPTDAPKAEVELARTFVAALVRELVKRGAAFVLPVDAEPVRPDDGLPICFDWLVWDTLRRDLHLRPSGAQEPFAVAVQHHKNEEQIPAQFVDIWDGLRSSDQVQIENASHWNMGSKRLEMAARWGDVLVVIGGGEGVLYLANLYHDAGKPVVPLNFPVVGPGQGARRLFELGLSTHHADRLFRAEGMGTHAWMNRINFPSRRSVAERVEVLVNLLEALARPRAFGVRLLNPKHPAFSDVQDFFDTVVEPVLTNELGFDYAVVDGRQAVEEARIDAEIFTKLHRSSIVISDLTGDRPNCFLELGYALGRGLRTVVTACEGTQPPFDVHTYAAFHWSRAGTASDRRRLFLEHVRSVWSRRPLVSSEPLIP